MRILLKSLGLLCLGLMLGASPALADGDTLIVGTPFNVKHMDPHFGTDTGSHMLATQIHESLLRIDAEGKVQPLLAERWERSEDGKAIKFFLKKGVKFHNGDVMTADDVIFSFKRAMGPEGAGIRAFSGYFDPAGIEKVDDSTVILRTKNAMGEAFIATLAHSWASIFNKKYTESVGKDYGMNPMGTGRFKFDVFVPANRIELLRFEDYHGEKAPLKKQIYRIILETSTRTIELESGSVDIILDPAQIDIKRIEDNEELAVVKVTSGRICYMSFDVTKPPYDNLKVRQAMNIAVNRRGLLQAVWKGYGVLATGPLAPAVRFNRVKESPEYEYNPEKARKLLAEAGFPKGFSGEILIPDRNEYLACATVLQENYMQIGLDMKIKVMEYGAFAEAMRRKGHEPFINQWWGLPPSLDAFFLITPIFHSAYKGTTNRSYIEDKQLDEWLDLGGVLNDGPERTEVYKKIWDRTNELLPWVNLGTPLQMYCIRKTLSGINYAATSVNYFGTAYFKSE